MHSAPDHACVEQLHSSSHKRVLNGGYGCPLSTHLGTKHHPFVTPGLHFPCYIPNGGFIQQCAAHYSSSRVERELWRNEP